MSSDEIVKGECQHCKGHIEFLAEMKGQKVDCPHCSKETWLTPPVPKKSQGDEKALDALKSGVGELAKAASIVAKKATDKAKEIAASDEVKNLKDKAGKAASELRDKANERVEGIQADPAAFKKRLVPIAMAASVILGFWLIRYQPWKSEFDRTLMWAERGDADAQHSMGQLYLGGEGVGKDTEEAASWFEKAAEQGHVDSMFNLGLMYSGVGGRRNDSKSRDWYQKAADGGDEEALSALGDLYLEGRGVRRDYAKAMELFSQSESVGNSLGLGGYMTEDLELRAILKRRLNGGGKERGSIILDAFTTLDHAMKQEMGSGGIWMRRPTSMGLLLNWITRKPTTTLECSIPLKSMVCMIPRNHSSIQLVPMSWALISL